MKVEVNKKRVDVPENCTISMLLDIINSRYSVAIFVNGKQLLMKEYGSCRLNENDNIRIIRPLGGG